MRRARFSIGLLLLCALLCTGCGAAAIPSAPDPADSAALQAMPRGADALAAAFAPAPEWTCLGLGYYCDATDTIRTGYVPYAAGVKVGENLLACQAHGVFVRLSSASARSAEEALSLAGDDFLREKQSDAQVLSAQLGEGTVVRGGTEGIQRAVYGVDEPDGTVRTCYVVLYAAQNADGLTYTMARMEFDPAAYDETSGTLIQELGNAYGLNLPTFS